MKKTIDLNIKTNLAGKLKNFLEQFLEYLRYQKSFSEKTIEAYYLDISQFITYLETDNNNFSIEKIDHNIIKAFLWDLKNSGFNHNSVRRKLSSLKSFFKYLQKEQIVENNPASLVSSGKKTISSPSFLTEDEINEMLTQIDIENWEGLRNRTILELFYATGVRLNELIGLKKENINENDNWILVTGKGSKQRYIPIGEIAKKYLIKYINDSEKEIPDYKHSSIVFVTKKGKSIYPMLIQRMVKNYLLKYSRVSQKSPHTLRHSFATHLL
ncbi:MAG: tyrosine-type recombinase/integrase, partial [Calditrichia bacterium]|nr:tyrosine-type recombinase/integrase [Calditrichia bacterium]